MFTQGEGGLHNLLPMILPLVPCSFSRGGGGGVTPARSGRGGGVFPPDKTTEGALATRRAMPLAFTQEDFLVEAKYEFGLS